LRASSSAPINGSIAARTYLFLGLLGLATGASWLCYFRALELGDAALVAPIDKLSVVLVPPSGVAVLGERLSALSWLGVALIAGGAIPGRLPRITGGSPRSIGGAAAKPEFRRS
jgi:transporter family protein